MRMVTGGRKGPAADVSAPPGTWNAPARHTSAPSTLNRSTPVASMKPSEPARSSTPAATPLRGRGRARRRHLRPRGRAQRGLAPASSRRSSCVTTTSRYGGKGVETAVPSVMDAIGARASGFDACEQRLVDQALIDLDGSPNKSRLGANALLGVSSRSPRAAAESAELPLFRYVGGPNAPRPPRPDDEHPQRRRARGRRTSTCRSSW